MRSELASPLAGSNVMVCPTDRRCSTVRLALRDHDRVTREFMAPIEIVAATGAPRSPLTAAPEPLVNQAGSGWGGSDREFEAVDRLLRDSRDERAAPRAASIGSRRRCSRAARTCGASWGSRARSPALHATCSPAAWTAGTHVPAHPDVRIQAQHGASRQGEPRRVDSKRVLHGPRRRCSVIGPRVQSTPSSPSTLFAAVL